MLFLFVFYFYFAYLSRLKSLGKYMVCSQNSKLILRLLKDSVYEIP
ncbi:hypothetical protein C427_0211 [Paraglaciecola psychrophila 170]|uniref:Uncharacterized protein n=1 Tax=Paraglaciecola psychrophila 170 TaxID=1129794 RepID=K7A692_9ALTE|nr:hypothetical protein C427_0211 [Paraglaciecola psychrophila 170]GAC37852.1 hypothetical protein GPSY_2231 [Paraglaciecola psychrophila 170]